MVGRLILRACAVLQILPPKVARVSISGSQKEFIAYCKTLLPPYCHSECNEESVPSRPMPWLSQILRLRRALLGMIYLVSGTKCEIPFMLWLSTLTPPQLIPLRRGESLFALTGMGDGIGIVGGMLVVVSINSFGDPC